MINFMEVIFVGYGLTVFLFYFSPISAGMFVFGMINAISYTVKGNQNKILINGIISTIGLLMLFGALMGMIMW